MKNKYLFQNRAFWVVLSFIYLAIFLINYVQVHYEIYFDLASPVMEQTYHLILRNAGLIQGGSFSRYSDSLAPVTYNLPYFILSIAVLSLIMVSIIYVVQKVYRIFIKDTYERS